MLVFLELIVFVYTYKLSHYQFSYQLALVDAIDWDSGNVWSTLGQARVLRRTHDSFSV